MTHPIPSRGPAAARARVDVDDAARELLAAEALPGNKASLFTALAAAGITAVVVAFDGRGHGGCLRIKDAPAGRRPATLPVAPVGIATARWDGSELHSRTLPLAEAAEAVAWTLLDAAHRSWAPREGVCAEVAFDVARREVRLDLLIASERPGDALPLRQGTGGGP
jgi:hypothetical protein